MKKYLSLFIVCCLLATNKVAYAETENNNMHINDTVISSETISTISQIPIFITYIDAYSDENIQTVKETVTDILSDDGVLKNLGSLYNEEAYGVNKIYKQASNYKIIKISDSEKKALLYNPILESTYNSVQKLVDEGTKVNYLNIFLPNNSSLVIDSSVSASSGDINDPKYWETNYNYLGTYNGYKFLYLESAAGVESSQVKPGNLSGSLKWTEITKKTLEAVLDHFVKGVYYKAVKAVSDALSTMFSLYETPLSVTYSSSSEYVKAKVSGDVYMRTIVIRDDLDRISGYAYYPWGSTQRFAAALRVDAKYPYKKNASGTYDYRYPSYTYPTEYSYTPGYYGNSTLYSSIIDYYTNTIGYFTHDENININSIVAKLLG